MPHAVLNVSDHISTIYKEHNLFVSEDKSVFLYPIELEHEAFFLRLTQKGERLIVKLEKATIPKITSSLKAFIFDFSNKLAKRLNGTIVVHNLNQTKRTNYNLFEKYEIKTDDINKNEWINSLCKNSKINLEIGMGSGEFITEEASKNKKESFVGIEILNSDFYIALRRFDSANLDNIKAVYYDARAVLNRFRPNSVNRVYLNFPEPWFKKKKIKHSILTPKTAREIESLLEVGGEFVIMTDNYPFAVSSALIIESSTHLNPKNRNSMVLSDTSIKTKYEKKWINYKRTIYKLAYKKCVKTEEPKIGFLNFPLKILKKNMVKNDYVFKVLNEYTNSSNSKTIIEITAGYSKNPQHIFFDLSDDNLIKPIPQSNFVVNSDLIFAIDETTAQ